MKSYQTAAHNPNSGLSDERRFRELNSYTRNQQRKTAAVAELRRLGRMRKKLFADRESGWLTFAEYQRRDEKIAKQMKRIRQENGINR